jgi:hypothetical protein
MNDERNLLGPWSPTTLRPFVAFVTFCKKISVLELTSVPVGCAQVFERWRVGSLARGGNEFFIVKLEFIVSPFLPSRAEVA